MGIKGLLPIVSPCLKKRHISSFKNHRIGIDGHSWLHSILPSIALQLYNNVQTTLHHEIFLKRIRVIQKYGAIPVIVFDGESLPSKHVVNERRRIKREQARTMAELQMSKGNIRDAMRHIACSISISPHMVAQIAQFLRDNGVEVIVSPYESDAQLAYLQRINYVHSIITEDSDLIVYNCNNVLYKYGNGYVMHYERGAFRTANEFVCDNLLDVSILSGCDYLENVRGVGISSAVKMMRRYGSVELVINEMRRTRSVPEDYLSCFVRARLTFKYQVVYDPVRNERVYLDGSRNEKGYDFLGRIVAVNRRITCGDTAFSTCWQAVNYDVGRNYEGVMKDDEGVVQGSDDVGRNDEGVVKDSKDVMKDCDVGRDSKDVVKGGKDIGKNQDGDVERVIIKDAELQRKKEVNDKLTHQEEQTNDNIPHVYRARQINISPKKCTAKNHRTKMLERLSKRK